jgi:hypothetical protein
MTREDLAAYQQSQFDQKYAPQPADRPVQYSSQSEMFPTELQQAQDTVAGIQGPAAPEVTTPQAPATTTTSRQGELDLGGQDLFGAAPTQPAAIAPEDMQLPGAAPSATPTSATPAGQGALPLVGGRTQEQQIVEMYVADQNAQAVTNARAKQAERAAQGEAGVAAAQQERLKFESDLAATDARLQQTRQRTTEDNRLGLLLPLVADTNVANIPKAFGRALQAAGFTDTQFTPRERELIQRAYDVRAAEPVAPAETSSNEMDVYKPARAQEPQQIGLPGFATPKGTRPAAPEPEAPAPAPAPALITEQSLDVLKLPKAAALRKRLLGKDMSDPVQNQEVNTELRAALQNPNLPADARQAIKDVVQQSEFTRQGEMFGPRGGALPQPKSSAQGAQDANQRTSTQPPAESRASKPPVGVARPSSTTGAAVSGGATGVSGAGQRRLADTGGRAKSDTTGAKGKPATVSKKDAYAEGVQSAKAGESALGSPYPEGTAEHDAFNEGYLDTKYPSSKAKKDTEVKKEAPKKPEAEKKAPADPIASLVQQTQAAIGKAPKKGTTEAAPVADNAKAVVGFVLTTLFVFKLIEPSPFKTILDDFKVLSSKAPPPLKNQFDDK